jgi:hypothetical protein
LGSGTWALARHRSRELIEANGADLGIFTCDRPLTGFYETRQLERAETERPRTKVRAPSALLPAQLLPTKFAYASNRFMIWAAVLYAQLMSLIPASNHSQISFTDDSRDPPSFAFRLNIEAWGETGQPLVAGKKCLISVDEYIHENLPPARHSIAWQIVDNLLGRTVVLPHTGQVEVSDGERSRTAPVVGYVSYGPNFMPLVVGLRPGERIPYDQYAHDGVRSSSGL